MGKVWKSTKRGWRFLANADLAWSLLQYLGLAKGILAFGFAVAVAVTAYLDALPWWAILLASGAAFVVTIWAFNGILFLWLGRRPQLVPGPDEEDARRQIEISEADATGDTMAASGTVSDPTPKAVLERLLHTCYVLASTQKMRSAGFIELTVVAYNASEKTLALADILGNTRCTVYDEEGHQVEENLPVPDLVRLSPKRQVAPFSEFVMTLNQPVSPRTSERIIATAKKQTVTLNFDGLRLEFAPFQEPGPFARLKLWDGVGISAARGLRSGRAHIARVQASVGVASRFGRGEGG